MRKTMLLLALSLAVLTALLPSPGAEAAGGFFSCPQCVTYSDGSQCCVPCRCTASGIPIACADVYCLPPDGLD